jgi:enoyl-CoA hydratase / 3-hydroxyacyl-CoA dehydrogenase
MFVFKAAVLGGGDEIAEAIEAAGIAVVRDADALGDVDLVIDAGPGDLEAKQRLFSELDDVLPGQSILAATTSSQSVTEIAEATSRPDRVVGLHFVGGTRLVEVVEGHETSAETIQAAVAFAQAIRRAPIRCVDAPGLVADRLAGKEGDDALVEACLILEEGVATSKDIELASGGAFGAADREGLDGVLARLVEPPSILRRLVAQGRLGVKAGHGFFPYPRPDEGWDDGPVKLETRGNIAIVWLDCPPANSLSPTTIDALAKTWAAIDDDKVRAMILASANPQLFCAGADIKAFTQMDEADGRALLDATHDLLRAWERSSIATIAAVNALAFGGGCELAMACDVRVAAYSALFGQPEINLGIIPGFGGTQRLPRLVGESKALEMNLTGEPISAEDAYEVGLVNRVVPDHELFDVALAWATKLAGQAPLAVHAIKRVSAHADLDEGIAAEKSAFVRAFGSEDAREGIAAFLEKREATWRGR